MEIIRHFREFEKSVIEILEKEDYRFKKSQNYKKKRFKNLFEFAGCQKLYLANKYTRTIAEKLGHYFEKVANLSPRFMDPETTLGFRLKGIDAIIYLDNKVYYAQIKTKRDTLTGSQASRSIEELKIHPNALFAIALDMGNGLNPSLKKLNKNNIKSLVGMDFWSGLGIDYTVMLDELCKALRRIETSLYSD